MISVNRICRASWPEALAIRWAHLPLYLGNEVYRIHGTNAPERIGHAVSSGCFRLVNDQIADLFERVPVDTKIMVRQ
jgi:lipoprotein-anchoring transpeptidase ErfK/SrfK